ncbi:MAG: transposase [Acidobacteria bacterium]|nr:transposase [Acidobacteriota bacterium]
MSRAYRRRLPHYQTDFRAYFVTFNTRRRWLLPPVARSIVLDAILAEHGVRMSLCSAIVMPEHVHFIAMPLPLSHGECFALSEILQRIKGRSSFAINRALGRAGALWQRESFDHELRHEESLREKCQYLIQNPVRRGLVSTADEYRWLWREWLDEQFEDGGAGS